MDNCRTRLLKRRWLRDMGRPVSIICDRDPRLASNVLRSLQYGFKVTSLDMSTCLHHKPMAKRHDYSILFEHLGALSACSTSKFDENAMRVLLLEYFINSKAFRDSPQSSKDVVANDAGKKTNEEPAREGERNGQEKERGASNKENDQNVQDFRDSTVSPSVSTVGQNFTNVDDLPTDPLIPDLEDTSIFSGAYDDEDVGVEADLNNLEITMNVSPIPTTRIHKDLLKTSF
ncbi:hypothetical protein Tco_0226958 [Tanacetum coccineum]